MMRQSALVIACLLATKAQASAFVAHRADRTQPRRDLQTDSASPKEVDAEGIRSLSSGPSFTRSSAPGSDRSAAQLDAKELAAYHTYNHEASERNPKLAMVLDDPDRFVANLKARFEKQKTLTPSDPYAFDFSDYGLPVLAALKDQLDHKIEKVGDQLQSLQAEPAPLRLAHRAQIKEHQVGLAYLTTLSQDVGSHLDAKQIGYRRLLELSFFGARAMGHFDLGDLSLKDRVMLKGDRYLQGYRSTSIAEERRRYDHDAFTVFQAESPVQGFKAAQKPFEDAFFNKDKMELIALPTTLALDGSELMRLVPYNIFLLGITDKPFPADGFVRPGGDFWLHDIRHSSAIFSKRKAYEAQHGLTEPQSETLRKEMDVWKLDLDESRAKVTDADLGAAIDLIVFNTHHDRGLPIAPSSFVNPTIDYVPQALYATYRVAGQSVPFKDPHRTMTRAYAWLRAFWMPRMSQETALWSAAR